MSAPAVRHPGEYRWEVRLLVVVAATLTVFGIANLYGATSVGASGFLMAMRQFAIALAGGLLVLVLSRVDYRRLRPLAWPILVATVLMLVVTALPEGLTGGIAPERNGARRWINLPGIPEFQPSEVAKYAVVLWAAALAAKKGGKVREFKKGVLPFLVVYGLVFLLIMRQPNLSMAVVVGLLGGVVLFAAGARIGHFILLAGSAGLVAYQLIITSEYRSRRLAAFLGEGSAESAMQVNESVVALGSGQIVGLGFGQGRAKLAHVPYAYSDFIFSSIGEEWGLIGVLVVVGLFATFGWIGYRIARTAPDLFGQLLATGLTTAICLTAGLHMAVTLKLMPTTGLTLPFVSHGGSSLLMTLAATGILASIGRMRGRPTKG